MYLVICSIVIYKTSFCLLSSYKNILFDNQFLLPFLGLWADCILMQVVTWHKALLVLKLKALSTYDLYISKETDN